MFLGKAVLKICRKFTGEHPWRSAICNFIKITWVFVFSCKFVAYFQNTFSEEHLWTAASVIDCSRTPHKFYGWKFNIARDFVIWTERKKEGNENSEIFAISRLQQSGGTITLNWKMIGANVTKFWVLHDSSTVSQK